MQVLVQLATHANEVLSKEQLMQKVWSDTFVGDEVLTRCISEIRRVLDDNARSPRFVQTIPKVGYRLIAPVELPRPADPSANASVVTNAEPAKTTPPLSASRPWLARVFLIVCSIVLAGAAVWIALFQRTKQTAPDFRTLPFTSYAGYQTQPAFSPDGTRIAFVWNGDDPQHGNIYVKMIGTENPVRFTSGPGNEYSPAWSPDGRYIAFLRAVDDNNQGLYVIPSIGGPPRKLSGRTGVIDLTRVSITWSPDGKHIVFSDGKSTHSPSSLFTLNFDTLQVTRLTQPDPSWDGDYSPAYSPDGKTVGFIRDVEGSVRDVYTVSAEGGEPSRLTSDNRQVASLAWSSDGSSIIFSSDRAGKYALWRIAIDHGTPERLPVGTEDAFYPAVSPRGNRLAFTQTSAQWSIMRLELASNARDPNARLLSSTEQDSAPRYSPDGSRIAFQSWRSGTQEIWVCDSEGRGPVRLTSFNGPLTGSPFWSPDGQQIAFDSRPEGRSHIYVVPANGGTPRKITSGDQNDILPTWSRDMKSLYFASNRGGTWNIWKTPVSGGEAVQITNNGGFVAVESFDSQSLYFTKADLSGLWRIPVAGGNEEQVLTSPKSGFWGYWSVAKGAIYYLDNESDPPYVAEYDLATRRSRRLRVLEHTPPVYNGLSVAPDGKTAVYTDATPAGSHITLVENFR